jgi:hypothetical protein
MKFVIVALVVILAGTLRPRSEEYGDAVVLEEFPKSRGKKKR